jgi:hypothetical protein
LLLHVICSGLPGDAGARLQALARFLGVEVCALTEPPRSETASHEGRFCLAATCESLNTFLGRPSAAEWLSGMMAANDSTIFLTGCETGFPTIKAVDALVPKLLESVAACDGRASRYCIESAVPAGMPQFANLTFGPVEPKTDGVFAFRSDAKAVTELVTIDGRPCYVKVTRERASYYLLACKEVADVDGPVSPGQQPLDAFLQFVPFLAFLRLTFGSRCWHNETQAACFIVDDPPLKPRYGFLDFRRLESRLADSRFSLNVAFIPWNYRRTDTNVAECFRRSDRRFSISVHGCDHTEGEFGSTDKCWLWRQAHRALARMDLHEKLTGIRHNRVMVFPQGVFSRASLRALHDAGFVAAVNSTIVAIDARPGETTFRDLIDVAVDRFDGVPLFRRHYPDRFEKTALEAFLGNQLLFVEHHGYFRHGYEEAAQYVSRVNSIAPTVVWSDLEEVCGTAALTRAVSSTQVDVRAFGPTVRLMNRTHQPARYRITNRWAHRDVESISSEARGLDFERSPSAITCSVLLDPGEHVVLRYHRRPITRIATTVESKLSSRVKVFARRHLCEVRDNHLSRSALLSRLARAGKLMLPKL